MDKCEALEMEPDSEKPGLVANSQYCRCWNSTQLGDMGERPLLLLQPGWESSQVPLIRVTGARSCRGSEDPRG